MGNDNAYWDWRDEQLKAGERAKGGEPCQACGEPVPARAHWKHRDRHVCSPRCNLTLNWRFNRRIERGEITRPPVFSPDPQGARPARAFRTLPAGSLFPYEIQGYSPKPGDVVERHGSVIAVHRAVDLPDYAIPWQVRPHSGSSWQLEQVALSVHMQTGAAFYYLTDHTWTPTSLILGAFLGLKPLDDTFGPFEAEGWTWRWYMEIIRDVDETDQEYTWTAFVCGKESVPRLWTPAYAARSERLQRVSRAAGSYAARMREMGLEATATVERLDPLAVYERDGWICQICKTAVERERAWPDMWCATLDHRIPLTAGGEHTLLNVQLSHWICNLHKGDYFPVDL